MVDYVLTLSEPEIQRYREMARDAVAQEAALWSAAGVRTGAVVADVGCGPGAVAVALAEAVGPTGRVHALDADPDTVRLAAELAARSELPQVSTGVGDAADTGLPERSVHVAMLRNVLAHNGGREQQIVDHLAVLLRPGGCVYLVDADGTGIRSRPADPDIADLQDRYVALHRGRGNDVSIGLRLDELLAAAGLTVESFTGCYRILRLPPGVRGPAWAAHQALLTAGLADPADVERWDAAYRRADAAAIRPTLFVPVFVGIGRRPR